jgi:hypothetical protein
MLRFVGDNMIANSNPQRHPESEPSLAQQEDDRTAGQPAREESEFANVPAPRDEFEYQRRLFFGR